MMMHHHTEFYSKNILRTYYCQDKCCLRDLNSEVAGRGGSGIAAREAYGGLEMADENGAVTETGRAGLLSRAPGPRRFKMLSTLVDISWRERNSQFETYEKVERGERPKIARARRERGAEKWLPRGRK